MPTQVNMMIRLLELEQFCPRPSKGEAAQAAWDGYVAAITSNRGHELMAEFGVLEHSIWPLFAGTFAAECGGLTLLRENMSYRAARILEVFGAGVHSARVTPAEAAKLAGNSYALSERVYGIADPKCCRNVKACTKIKTVKICKARELGNHTAGDGYAFRGCGLGQNTGRTRAEKDAAGVGCAIDALDQPINSLHAMLLEWRESKINELIAETTARGGDVVLAVCRKWNGGTNGLEDRRARTAKARKIWPKPMPIAALLEQTASGETAPRVLELGDFDLPADTDGPVRQAQQQLTAAKFYTGSVDGNFASLMQRAVAGFQVAHGIPGTGKIDTQTSTMLAEVARNPPASVPGREAITATDLLARGSQIVAVFARVAATAWLLIWSGITWLTDKALNLGMIDGALDTIDKAKKTAAKLSGLFGIVDAGAIGGLAALLAGAALLAWATKGKAAAVTTAQQGDKPA